MTRRQSDTEIESQAYIYWPREVDIDFERWILDITHLKWSDVIGQIHFSVEDSWNNLSNCDTSMKFGKFVAQTLENTNHLLDIENIQYGG